MRIVIDPGHGGMDPGAVGPNGTRESDVNLDLALRVRDKLIFNNFEIFMTRDADVSLGRTLEQDLDARSNIANSVRADYFISIHCNSSYNKNAMGIESYALAPGGDGEKLANSIQGQLVEETGRINRGVKFENFSVLRKTKMPAVLVELCFISNSEEEVLLNDNFFLDRLSHAISKGVCNFLGLTYKMPFNQLTIRYNGRVFDFFGLNPKVIDNYTYVPLRFLVEFMGKRVIWDPDSKCIDIID